jgi:hypothetical protein
VIAGLIAGIYFINKHQRLEAMKEYVEQVQTPYERHYLNENGTITAEISNAPIQYLDKETNEWKPISTSIKEKDQQYVVEEHVFKATFGKKGNEPVTFEQDGYRIVYIPINANDTGADVTGNTITYANIWPNTDLQYEVTPMGLKMTLHLSDEQAPKAFAFKMLVDGLKPVMNDDGSLNFYDENGQEKFSVPTMWVKDSSGEEKELYDRLNVTLDKIAGNEYLLGMTVEVTGLTYPLIIDPTTTISGNDKVQDAYTVFSRADNSGSGDRLRNFNTNELQLQRRDAGSWDYPRDVYVRFDMSSIPEGSSINSASLQLYLRNIYKDGVRNPVIRVYTASRAWDETAITYQNAPGIADLQTIYDASNLKTGWLTFDVTPHVYDVVHRLKPNYGLVMYLYGDTYSGDRMTLTFDSSEGANSPRLVVDYTLPSDWRSGAKETVTITDVIDSAHVSKAIRWEAGTARKNAKKVYLVKFNLNNALPSGVKIKKALLYVRKESDSGSRIGQTPYYYSVSPVLSDWTPGQTTIPTLGTMEWALNSVPGPDYYFDVTYSVIRMTKGYQIYGWAVDTHLSHHRWDSDDYATTYFYTASHPNASFRPKLIITYEVNNTPPTTPGPFTAPTPGDRWYGTHTISWGASTDPDGDPVTYELEFFNGTSWKTIATNISGTSYNYNFANEPATSTAKLRVRAKDSRGAYSDYRESPVFSINKAPGAPTILEPKNGETVFNDRAIKWTAASDPNGDALTYQLQLSTDNGTIWKDIGTTSDTSFIYNFNVEDSSAAARVRVRAYDGQLYGPWATSEAFIINGAPRITLVTPLDNGINYSAPQEFKWEIRDADNDLVKSRLYVDDSPVYETGFEDAGIKTATVDLSGAYEGAHTWYVEAIDAKGAIMRSDVRTLIVQKPLHEPNVLYLPRGEVPPGEFVRDLGENRKMYRKVEQTPDGEVGWLYIVEFYDPPQGVGDLKIAP